MALERERTKSGEDEFDVVFNANREYIYRLVYALLGNTQDAEDVTQEVFLRVYRALPSFDPERATMRTWLTKVAVNACQTHRRRNFLRGIFQRNPEDDADTTGLVDLSLLAAPEDHALQTELRRTVQAVLTKLKPDHRTVLVLHYYMDFSCPEIADMLNCPEGTVHSRLHHARRMVQTRLEEHAPHSTHEVI
jgi:RNA polymerase sigma-70 factor (ECF subfamily)